MVVRPAHSNAEVIVEFMKPKYRKMWAELAKRARRCGPMPIFVFTDVGRDIDDALFLTFAMFLQRLGIIKIMGIVTTHMAIDRRVQIAIEMYRSFGSPVPVACGNTYTVGREADPIALDEYVLAHMVGNRHYEGKGLLDVKKNKGLFVYREPFELFVSATQESLRVYGKKLTVFCLSPMTDFFYTLQKNRSLLSMIEEVFIMGSAKVKDGMVIPDTDSYNVKEDQEAAEGVTKWCQDYNVSMTWVGKWLAYEMVLSKKYFFDLEATGHEVGHYLRTAAELGLICFSQRDPKIFKALYRDGKDFSPENPLEGIEDYSKPYDPTTLLVLLFPEEFQPVKVGIHRIIGSVKNNPNTQSVRLLRELLMGGIAGALQPSEIEILTELSDIPQKERFEILSKIGLLGLTEDDIGVYEVSYGLERYYRLEIRLDFGRQRRAKKQSSSSQSGQVFKMAVNG